MWLLNCLKVTPYILIYGLLMFSNLSNALTWTYSKSPSVNEQYLEDVAWGNSKFVAVSSQPYFQQTYIPVFTSTNGKDWKPNYDLQESMLFGVAWNGSKFVIVGADGLVLTSTDGEHWAKQTSNTDDNLSDVTWGKSLFIATSWEGNMFSSPDGITWKKHLVPESSKLNSVIWGDGKFVAVGKELGAGYIILSSLDGKKWNKEATGFMDQLRGVAWSGTHYVAVGQGRTILRSLDAKKWTQQGGKNSGFYLRNVMWGGNQFIAMGDQGNILTSNEGINWTGPKNQYPYYAAAWSDPLNTFVAVGAQQLQYTTLETPPTSVESLFTINIDAQSWTGSTTININGVGHCTALLAGSPRPTAASIRDNNSIFKAGSGGSVAMTGLESSNCTVTGLTPNTLYDFYFVAGTATGSLQSNNEILGPVTERTELLGPPITTQTLKTHSITSNDWEGSATINENGIGFCTALITGSPTPTADEVKFNNNRYKIGNTQAITLHSNTNNLCKITGLDSDTEYDFYFVAETNNGKLQSNEDISGPVSATTTSAQPIMMGISYMDNYMVALRNNNTIIKSYDDIYWSEQSSQFQLMDIDNNGLFFVAVGKGGSILTSVDGSKWKTETSRTNNTLYGISWSKSSGIFTAVGEKGTILGSKDGKIWEPQNSNTEIRILDVVSSETIHIAVGESGLILRLDDGGSWQKIETPGTRTLRSIEWNGSKFVSVGANGSIVSSPNGSEWALIESGTSSNFQDITWANEKFVAVGREGRIFTSNDGDTWKGETSWTNDSLYGVTWNGNEFIAIGKYPTTLTSPDGYAWNLHSYIPSSHTSAIAWSGTLKMYAAIENNRIITSTDGVNWTKHETPTSSELSSITWGEDKFIAVGKNGTILSSGDGIQWEAARHVTQGYLTKVVRGKSMYVAVGPKTILTSPNGHTWTVRKSSISGNIDTVIWDGQNFVAIASNKNVYTSENGIDWEMKSKTDSYVNSLAYGNSMYVAAGWDGIIKTSVDGVTWVTRNSGTRYFIHDLIWANSKFIAVTTDGILISQDGISWEKRSNGGNNTWGSSITWNGEHFLVIGGDGRISTSPHGDIWTTKRTSILYGDWSKWVESKFFIMKSGLLFSSPYGEVWTKSDTPITQVEWNGNEFVGWISKDTYLSNDGINWVKETSKLIQNYTGVSFGDSQFWIVGDSGSILTSSDSINWKINGSLNTSINYITKLENNLLVSSDMSTFQFWVNDGWEEAYPLGGKSILDAAYNNHDTLLVNKNGNIELLWAFTQAYPIYRGNVLNPLHAIIWGNHGFVAVGEGVIVTLSKDNTRFTSTASNIPNAIFNGISWGSGKYVAVGENGLIMTSSDASTWSPTVKQITNLNAVTWNGSRFVGVGDNGFIISSKDGLTWQQRKQVTTNNLNSVKWVDSTFLAVGDNQTIVRSLDGVKWHTIDAPKAEMPPTRFIEIKRLNTKFYQQPDFNSTSFFLETTEGKLWSPIEINNSKLELENIEYGASTYVAYYHEKQSCFIVTSTNFIDWKKQKVVEDGCKTISWDGVNFLIYSKDKVYISSKGIDWEEKELSIPSSSMYLISGSNGHFGSIGVDDSVFLSPDGYTWSKSGFKAQQNAQWLGGLNFGYDNRLLISAEFSDFILIDGNWKRIHLVHPE